MNLIVLIALAVMGIFTFGFVIGLLLERRLKDLEFDRHCDICCQIARRVSDQ